MQDIQDIFNRIQVKKGESKDLKTVLKDALDNSFEYQKLVEEINVLRRKKKELEGSIKDDLTSEMTRLEEIKMDIKSDQELMRDVALTRMMRGETVQVIDEYKGVYQPIFSVKFKKMND